MATIKVEDPARALVELGALIGLDLLGAVSADSSTCGPRA
jgi:hypothetical protein